MEETIVNLGNLLEKFQHKFIEIEDILQATNKQYQKLQTEYLNCKKDQSRENQIMSMNDFVRYMSALEEINDSGHSNSEIPLESEADLKEQTVSFQKQKRSISKSFSWQEVIHEEEEENTQLQLINKDEGNIVALQRPTSLSPFTNVKKFKSNPEFGIMGFVATGSIEGSKIKAPECKGENNIMKIR